MSVNSTNPSQLFGGTWTQISGRFLYCTTTSKTLGGNTVTGSTALTINQIPPHTHAWGSWIDWYQKGGTTGTVSAGNSVSATSSTGGGQGHTHAQNLPPYFTVYCWYRVS